MVRIKYIQWVITMMAVVVAIVHSYFPGLTIDGITVTLLAIASLPWLAPLFKSVELPGGIKVEFQDLESAKKKVEKAGLVKESNDSGIEKRHIYAFESVAGNDPNLALAGLRIEIESRLREIGKTRKISPDRLPLRRLTHELVKKNVLNSEEVSAIEDLLPLLNSAVHGAGVDERATAWALEFGPRLLNALGDRLGETTIPRLIERWKKRDGAEGAEVGTELSKSLVRAPAVFMKAMREKEGCFSPWLEGIGQHTFTIYESRGEVEDDLYLAYYEKLKQLMIEAVEPLVDTEYEAQANRVLEALSNVDITRIW